MKKDELQRYYGREQWFPLKPVNASTEVQVSLQTIVVMAMSGGGKVECTVPSMHRRVYIYIYIYIYIYRQMKCVLRNIYKPLYGGYVYCRFRHFSSVLM